MEQVHIIKERLLNAPSEAAAKREAINSKNTLAVAAASASGVKVVEYTRTIEDTQSGPASVVSFALEEGFFEFRPDFAAENISTGEMLRRLRDERWQRDNPHHPIAYMAAALESYKRITRAIREAAPLLRIPRGSGYLLLNIRGDRDEQRRLMQKAKVPEADIESIIAQMEAAK
jgi:hypothetical protein